MLSKESGAKAYAIIYLLALLSYLIFIWIDISEPIKQETFDNLGKFLFYAGSGFFAIIGMGNITLFKK